MARSASPRRALEYTIDVARLAARAGVHSGERKSGFDVVEIF
jgi:hypothetical protein